ncbi:DUF3429 domain-containing protein [Hyphococcus luteus]|uniref:DUF3429 domain-containing protein n=1 Tax=Hyphococcus luteus TaxID=2058213 RepID=A0A2S7K9I8_9PROT|nr:DUF3429 domain-containing protein [Marinicaulis flavus]PQA89170.1 hypothetical protein CW354_04275 [Marinicaulis flavus]
MAKNRQQAEMTKLGLYGLAPFFIAAAALWASPTVLAPRVALGFHQIALVYGAVIVAYLAGAGAGTSLAPAQKLRESFVPGQLITLAAFAAIIPDGVFSLYLGAVWRHVVILVLLAYLLMRDLNAVNAGLFPKWYGALRTRLTFWAGLALLLIISRLLIWGYY